MKTLLIRSLLAFSLLTSCPITHAGFDEGLAAYQKRNFATALKEWRPLAEQGNAVAQYSLGVMYDNGQGVPQDFKEAVRWYRLAADQGNAVAQSNLGFMYGNGRGVPQDFKEAVRWYRLAADQGDAMAQNNLGAMYGNGQGVPQDFKEAVRWYRLAADQGHASAQHNLGVRYDNGQGVPQDFKEAVRWYRSAADQGHAGAQNNLGAMFGQAHGVPHLPVLQHALYNLARAQGNETAASNLKNLEPDLTPQEIADAQALARDMAKPGGLIKALDAYVKAHPAGKSRKLSSAPPAGPYPAQPAKRPGVVSCNTNCNNGDCYRTYDSGRKVHFQAKHRYDALQGNWIWDAGSC